MASAFLQDSWSFKTTTIVSRHSSTLVSMIYLKTLTTAKALDRYQCKKKLLSDIMTSCAVV
jgi:hypothetical protein